jgi:DNA uptake protein ComE-like DNA-binding protein
LIANGLARIHGRRAAPPGASSSAAERQKLKDLENQAKQAKLGGWAANIERSSAPAGSVPSKNARLFPAKFDINAATEKELRLIPGIGPVMARRIIDSRPFRSADDLKKVNGIGEKKYDQIRPYFQ